MTVLPAMGIPVVLNIVGLWLGLVGAILMFYFPPRVRLYNGEGRQIVSWLGDVKTDAAAKGRLQILLSTASPWMLALAFGLQLLSLVWPDQSHTSYEMAERCNKSAAQAVTPPERIIHNHYNTRLDRCFAEMALDTS